MFLRCRHSDQLCVCLIYMFLFIKFNLLFYLLKIIWNLTLNLTVFFFFPFFKPNSLKTKVLELFLVLIANWFHSLLCSVSVFQSVRLPICLHFFSFTLNTKYNCILYPTYSRALLLCSLCPFTLSLDANS